MREISQQHHRVVWIQQRLIAISPDSSSGLFALRETDTLAVIPANIHGIDKRRDNMKPVAKLPTVRGGAAARIGRVIDIDIKESVDDPAKADMVGDTFAHLYNTNPIMNETPSPERAVNAAIQRWASEQDGFQKMREQTSGRLPQSMFSTPVFWNTLTSDKTIKDALDKQKEAEEKAKERDEELKKAQEEQKSAGDNPSSEQKQSIAEHIAKATKAQADAQAVAQEAVEMLENAKSDPMKKQVMASAVGQAADKAEKTSSVMRGWGIDDGVTQHDLPVIKQMIDSSFADKVARMLGRFAGVARITMQSVKESFTGVVLKPGLTDQPQDAWTSELVWLSTSLPPITRVEKIQAMVDHQLLGWQPTTIGKTAGDFKGYIDVSGSVGRDNAALMKAIALGICKAAKEESEREWEIMDFDYHLHTDEKVTDKDDWRNLFKWATGYSGGGTSFDAVFQHMTSEWKKSKAANKPFDGLVLSDGICGISDDLKAKIKDMMDDGTRLIYIQIGGWGVSPINEFATLTLEFPDFKEFEKNADKVVEQVARQIAEHYLEEGND